MTYVELMVVLSIFAVLSLVAIFNYSDFQDKINIKSLANDIALKVVEAQKSALSGLLPSTEAPTVSPWKPSYGVYFNLATSHTSFLYFADLNDNNLLDDSDCIGECLSKISITQNDSISGISIFYPGDPTAYALNDLTVSFTRPNSDAIIKSSSPLGPYISYVQISIVSQNGSMALIKLYPSGRVEID